MSLVEQEIELSRELWDTESQNSSMTLAKATLKGLSSPVWMWLKDQIFAASEFPLHNLEPLFWVSFSILGLPDSSCFCELTLSAHKFFFFLFEVASIDFCGLQPRISREVSFYGYGPESKS